MTENQLKSKTVLTSNLTIWLLVFLSRLVLLSRFSASPDFVPNGDDMKFYYDWGQRIMHGQWTDGQAFYGLPGYAYALALLGGNPFAVGLLQCVFEAFTGLFLVKIGKEAFSGIAGEKAALGIGIAAALGWLCFQPAQAFSIIMMPTSWIVCAFWGMVYWILKTSPNTTWRTWLGMGLLSGFCAMFVATILLLLPLIIVAIAMRTRAGQPLQQRLAPILVSVALLFIGVFTGCAPAWIHNRFIAHEPVLLSAHSGLNFWIGNNPAATGYPKIPPGLSASQEGLLRDSITLAEEEAGRKLKRWEVSEHWSAKAAKWRSENRAVWLKLLARKFSNFWNAFQYDDVSIISLLHSQGILPAGLRFGVVAVFAIPGLVLGLILVRRARWVVAAVLLHMAALMPVFVTERYRLCAVPGLLLFAAFLLWQLWKWLETYRWSPAFATMLATLASGWFVSESRGDIGLWSLDHYNTGIRCQKSAEAHRRRHEPAQEAQELEAARRELELAFAYVQDNSEINFALGNYWLARENRDKAKVFYRRTLELNPRHADCWNNVGYIAMEEKRWDTAIKCFERALKYQPEDIKTSYLLARAYKEAGKIDAAKAALAPALQRLPNQPDFLALKAQLDAAPAPPAAPQ